MYQFEFCYRGPEKPAYKADKNTKNNYPVVRFNECLKIISNYISGKVEKPKELNDKKISAFSYYYDRATEFGLIGM